MNLIENLYKWEYQMTDELEFSEELIFDYSEPLESVQFGNLFNIHTYRSLTDELLQELLLLKMSGINTDLSLEDLKKDFLENDKLKFSYGEINKDGVECISNFFTDNSIDTSQFNLYDLGSGFGRLIRHLSHISQFKQYIGIELATHRFDQSLILKEKYCSKDNVNFINQDYFKIQIEYPSILILHSMVTFTESYGKDFLDVAKFFWEKMQPGSILITPHELDEEEFETLSVGLDFTKVKKKFNVYRK